MTFIDTDSDAFENGDPFDIDAVEAQRTVQQKQVNAIDEATQSALETRRQAYTRLFSGAGDVADADIVVQDLMKFCRLATTTFHPDPRISAMLDGRREVALRVLDHTQLDFTQLFRKYNQGR